MSDQIKEFIEMPKQFMKEGSQFVNRCTKPDRKGKSLVFFSWKSYSKFNVFKLLILVCRIY